MSSTDQPVRRPLRVGYVNWSLGLGGAEQVIIQLALACHRRGHEVSVFTLNDVGEFAAPLIAEGIPVVALHKRGHYDASVLWRLAGEFRRRKLDVVHTHLWGGNLWGRLAARLAKVPIVVTTEHNLDSWKPRSYMWLDRWLAGFATSLVAVSQQVRGFYESHRVGIGRWQVIYNGVDVQAMPPRGRRAAYAALGIGADAVVVGWIGRFVGAKAPERFVDAMAVACHAEPRLRALMIGDGPLREQTAAYLAERGLADRVILTGLRKDVPELLAGMDLLAFSSEREGLSIAMLEAMAAGVPIVATRVGGNTELIEDSVSGVLVEPNRPEALARAIVELARDPRRAAAIRGAARARATQRFSLDAMVDAYESLYRGESRPAWRATDTDRKRMSDEDDAARSGPSAPVRVVYIIDDLGVGGAQRQLVQLVRHLPRDRWQPIVIALSTKRLALAGELTRDGVELHTLSQFGKFDARCLWRLTVLLRRLQPAIVHTWLFTADCYGRVAAFVVGVPHTVCAIRSTVEDLRPHERVVNRLLTVWTSRVTINADAIRDGLTHQGGIPGEKIRTIYNGIETSSDELAARNGVHRADWQVPADARVVAMVARLARPKDHCTLIEAARQVAERIPNFYLIIVGDGPLRREIESQIKAAGLSERTRMLGERADARRLWPAIDLCVLATHYEGCSNVVMEAMAAGKPVVASDVGGNAELIVDGQTGRLVPPGDAAALAEAMTAILEHPDQLRAMGERSRQRVVERFTIERTVADTETLYQELLEEEPHA